MNAYYGSGDCENVNIRKRGIIMNDSLRIKVVEGLDYIREIEKAGADTAMRTFANFQVREQNELICETFAKKFVRLCNEEKELKDLTFNVVGTEMEVRYSVTILSKEKKMGTVKATLLRIVPKAVDQDFLEYSLEMDPNEYNEGVLVSRMKRKSMDFRGGKFYVSYDDSLLLKKVADINFWKSAFPKELMYKYRDESLLVDFVDVLNAHGYTDAIGIECVYMKRIYHNANKRYPLFKDLLNFEKVKILDTAMRKADRRQKGIRSIHFFAKATFEVLAEKDLHRQINAVKFYTKVRNYRNNDGSIRMVEYEYPAKKETLTTCFNAFDLWNVLVTGGMNNVDEVA